MPDSRPNFENTLVVTATYNEMGNLPALVQQVQQHAPGVHLLVVDDNSPDGTGEWATDAAERDAHLTCFVRPKKLGLGSAIVMAMEWAMARDFTYLINIDADFSHPPSVLPDFLVKIDEQQGNDVVIGSRYIEGGGVEGWPFHRRMMSHGVNLYARNLLRLPLRDCSSGYRCFRLSKLAEIDLRKIRSTGYAFHEEILFHLRCKGARFAETPITYIDRRYGESKINMREAFIALKVILQLAMQRTSRDSS
jgi:dolichol-phosphate mannosyltransferase